MRHVPCQKLIALVLWNFSVDISPHQMRSKDVNVVAAVMFHRVARSLVFAERIAIVLLCTRESPMKAMGWAYDLRDSNRLRYQMPSCAPVNCLFCGGARFGCHLLFNGMCPTCPDRDAALLLFYRASYGRLFVRRKENPLWHPLKCVKVGGA